MIKLSSNRRSILIAAVAGAAIALIMARNPLAATADTVYDIVNYPAEQDGWILSGTITTDGKTGPITLSDVDSWNWTVTNGVTTYSGSSSESVPYNSLTGVIATPTYLATPLNDTTGVFLGATMPPPGYDGYSNLGLQFGGHSNGTILTALFWNNGSSGTLTPWWTDFATNYNTVPEGFAFATAVPEPSTLTFLGVVAIGLLGYGWRRRRAKA